MVFPKCWIGLVWTIAFCVAQTQALLSEDELVRWGGLGPILGPLTFLVFIFGKKTEGSADKVTHDLIAGHYLLLGKPRTLAT